MRNYTKIEDSIGKKYNKLIVVSISELKGKNNECIVNCLCECGRECSRYLNNVRKGASKSCGCLLDEARKTSNITHGKSRNSIKYPLYKIWTGIKNRCYNPKNKAYKNYGGRGIKVCQEWLNDFDKFHNDMIFSYEKGLTLDRENNELGYSKDNCRWVERAVNNRNKRNTIYIEFNGNKDTLSHFCIERNYKYDEIYKKLKIQKLSIEEIIKLQDNKINK